MRQETLRWGLTMGLIAAVLVTLASAIGALIAPLRLYTSAEAVAVAVFARAMFVLITLGIALGLAYYGGLRSERDVRSGRAPQSLSGEAGTQTTQTSADVSWGERWNAINTGGIIMLCFWIAATVCSYLFPLAQPGVPQPHNQALSNAELHLILLVIYVAAGAGAGGIGGRSYMSRVVLDRLIVLPPLRSEAADVKPAQEVTTTEAAAGMKETPAESAASQEEAALQTTAD